MASGKRVKFRRCENNPILTPAGNSWEKLATFNPAALYVDGEIHLFYRAIGDHRNYVSCFGHAIFNEKLELLERQEKPWLAPDMRIWWEKSVEDPRISEIDGELYMTYVVTPTPAPPIKLRKRLNLSDPFESITRIHLVKISNDFNTFKRLGVITPYDADERDTVLFPERINGKIALLHRPSRWIGGNYGTERPSVWFAYLNEEFWMAYDHRLVMKPEEGWESYKIGPGCPPIKTEKGWLLIYHGVDHERCYRVGAALLDLDKPWKVIARSKNPIMVPEEPYEAHGDMPNVVFPEGAAIIKDELFLFYGGADKVCCAASVGLYELVDYILCNA